MDRGVGQRAAGSGLDQAALCLYAGRLAASAALQTSIHTVIYSKQELGRATQAAADSSWKRGRFQEMAMGRKGGSL